MIKFWKSRSKEYVTSLQERRKWKRETANGKIGDVVYVSDDNVSPLQWPIAKVIYVYSGPDQFVEVVKIITFTVIHKRSVHKLRKSFDVKDAA